MHAESLALKKGDFSFGPVTLDLNKGEFTAIMGHVGSGKTTLLELLSGLTLPDSGKMTGSDRTGIVFQHPEGQLFAENVFQDVAYGIKRKVKGRKEQEAKVLEALSEIGLSADYLWKSPFELSGGEQRKCAIAGVLVTEPDMLLLDEPLSGMSGKARLSLMESIGKMKEKGRGIVMVTHDPEAAALADRLLIMNKGKLVYDGSPEGALSSVENADKYGVEPTFAARVAFLVPSIGTALTLDEIVEKAGRARR